jgi:phage shock protein E
MRSLTILCAVFLGLSTFSTNAGTSEKMATAAKKQQQNGTKTAVKTLKSAEAKSLLQKQKEVVIVDVRTAEEFAAGHLKNAMLLNKYAPDFEAQIKALDKSKTYLLYCAKGGRSAEAASLMQNLGFTKIYDATEGFESLKKAGVTVEK